MPPAAGARGRGDQMSVTTLLVGLVTTTGTASTTTTTTAAPGIGDTAVLVVVWLAAGLLVPAGVAKLRRPHAARLALGLPRSVAPAIRALGVAELALAAAVILLGGRLATAALALAYLGFAVVALRQQRRGADCGCFGASRAPTGPTHVVVDVVAAAVAGVAATTGTAVAVADHLGALTVVEAATLVVLLLAGVAGIQHLLTGLPALADARRGDGAAAPATRPSAATTGPRPVSVGEGTP